MHYECPHCGSFKKPRVVSHFPPKIAICSDCLKKAYEDEFVKEDEFKFTPIPQL